MEEFDLKEVSKETSKDKKVDQKALTSFKRKVTLTVGIIATVIIAIILVMFFRQTTFDHKILLTEDLTRWNTLSFTEQSSIENSLGIWEQTETGYSLGNCSIRPLVGMSPVYYDRNDLEETNALFDNFKKEGKAEDLGEVFIPVADTNASVEFKFAKVNSTDGDDIYVLYRVSSQTGAIYTLTFNCGNNVEENTALREIITDPLNVGIVLHK